MLDVAGYYLATLEAATQHILDLAEQYEQQALSLQQDGAPGGEVSGDVFEDFAN